jgi:hypothetical protein
VSIVRDIAALGGIAARRELLQRGNWRELITIALMYRKIFRVRKGWYAAPGEHPDIVRAWRVGGRLACVSALAVYGVDEGDGLLHVEVPPNAARPRHPDDANRRLGPDDDVVLHWESSPGSRRLVSLHAAEAQARSCRPRYSLRQGSSPAVPSGRSPRRRR